LPKDICGEVHRDTGFPSLKCPAGGEGAATPSVPNSATPKDQGRVPAQGIIPGTGVSGKPLPNAAIEPAVKADTDEVAKEKEANEFASALLMPKAEITIALRMRRLDMARLAALKPEWRVSMQALLYRAQSLGLIEQQKAAWLWRRFAIDRIKLREPASLDFPPEIPGVVSRMVRLHLDTFGYSSGDLAKIMVACRFFRTFDQATASVCMTCG
jgi:hypothetical protein